MNHKIYSSHSGDFLTVRVNAVQHFFTYKNRTSNSVDSDGNHRQDTHYMTNP